MSLLIPEFWFIPPDRLPDKRVSQSCIPITERGLAPTEESAHRKTVLPVLAAR